MKAKEEDFKLGAHFNIPKSPIWAQCKFEVKSINGNRLYVDYYEMNGSPFTYKNASYSVAEFMLAGAEVISSITVGDLNWKLCPTKSVNKACGTCKEAFPYDPLPSNRPDGKTDCYRCKTMKGVFVS